MADKVHPAKADASSAETAGGEKAATAEVTVTEATTTATPASETATTTTTETKPIAAGTSLKEEPAAPGKAAVGVEDYERMRNEAFATAGAKTQEQRNEKWEQARAAAKEDSQTPGTETPAATEEEATPAATAEEAAATPETGAAATEIPAEPTEDEELPEKKRIRLAGLKDGHLVAAANEIARAENISFTEAWERVAPRRAQQPNAATATEAETQQSALRNRAEIEADIAAKKAEKKQAATDLDTGKMYEADESIEALRNELDAVDVAEYEADERARQNKQAQFANTVNGSKAKAITNWPEAAEDNSEFSKRMVELADQYEADPSLRHHVYEADAPFFFADLVAKEQGLLPKHLRKQRDAASGTPAAAGTTTISSTPAPGASTSTATRPAPVNQRAVGRPQPATSAATPASGAARTSQGGTEDKLGLDKIHSPHAYEEALAKAKKLAPAAA